MVFERHGGRAPEGRPGLACIHAAAWLAGLVRSCCRCLFWPQFEYSINQLDKPMHKPLRSAGRGATVRGTTKASKAANNAAAQAAKTDAGRPYSRRHHRTA